ncbi:hypothetical protein FRC02_001569 [Tulasnella sp. 418]|nr:hypothetical protein FRC02_001569 [Tulasnella sp. 418]
MLAAAIPPRTLPVDVPYLDAAAKLNLSQMSLAQISALKDIKMPLMRTPSDFEFVKSHNELVNGLQNDNRVEQVGQSGAATGSATPVLPHATLSEQGSQPSVVDPEWASFYAALADDDEEEYSESWKELSYAAEYGVDVFDWPGEFTSVSSNKAFH